MYLFIYLINLLFLLIFFSSGAGIILSLSMYGENLVISCFVHVLYRVVLELIFNFTGTWDIYRQCEKKCFTGGHRKGISSLNFSDEYRALLSGSFDHDLCLWSPFADKLIFKLTGHQAPILNAAFVPNTPQMISADIDGIVKIWDART